jgi:hypothetical protein
LYKKFGLVPDAVADKAKSLIAFYQGKPVPHLIAKPF